MHNINLGGFYWLPCQVKPGAFSEEVFVIIASDLGDWFGFIPMSHLRNQIPEGKTHVRAQIIDVSEDRFRANIPGEPVENSLYENLISAADKLDPIPA